MISPSLFNIEEYIETIPFDIEVIKKIELIEKTKLKIISDVFKLFAFIALKAYGIFFLFLLFMKIYQVLMNSL